VALLWLFSAPWACAAASEPSLRDVPTPASPGALGPNLLQTSDGVFLSWLEPVVVANEEPRHVLQVARLVLEPEPSWGRVAPVHRGDAFFANWADFPAMAEMPGGLLAHWLERLGDDTYAYGVRLARSRDGGSSWEPLGLLHDDRSPTEHGFVSFVPVEHGVQAFWLDGRAMAEDGPMALRTVLVRDDGASFAEGGAAPSSGVPASRVLDDRVCECCQTDAAATPDGPIVVYRDRSDDEVRDIWIVRAQGDGWSDPRPVAVDGWRIPGCPVNGPAVAASGERVVVVWFTGAGDAPAVKAAGSADGGASFGEPLLLDGARPLGRVDVAVRDDRAWAVWLAREEGGASLRLVTLRLSGDRVVQQHPAVSLASTGAARSSGFPRIVALSPSRLLVAWVATAAPGAEGQRVRTTLVELAP
jgi:hypothetical protein